MQLENHQASHATPAGSRKRQWVMLALSLGLLVGVVSTSTAQEEPDGVQFRRLANGVMYSISPESQKEETYSRHDLLGLLERDPNIGKRPWSPSILAKDVKYTREIWGLEFTFKPMRYVKVDIPQNSGKMVQKEIWYQVYYVVNHSDKPVRFVPRFMLHDREEDLYYKDRLIPVAMDPIRKKEDPKRKFLNSIQMSEAEIPPSTDGEVKVWGVVTWEDVDTRCDRFSVLVQGLTNAYKAEDENGKRTYFRKTLQLNFWRPGDEFFGDQREIRFGDPQDIDYKWVYM